MVQEALCLASEIATENILRLNDINLHLQMISAKLSDTAHAILIVDGAGWHVSSKDIQIPPNISLLTLPPYCPELNPIERIWLWIKDRHLSNIVIRKTDDIIEIGVKAWNNLTEKRVKSMGPKLLKELTKLIWKSKQAF